MMKAQDLAADALVLHQTSLQVESIDKHQIAQKVIRLTKSILELINHRSCLASEEDTGFYGSWYPKRSGPPISINKNKVGLNNLWQRYLMQVSKSVNVEQAKVIANCPEFSSLHRAFRTYANCDDEKEAISMLSNKALRPAGASKDALSLGNKRPCVGPETSKKRFKVLTSTDPDLKI